LKWKSEEVEMEKWQLERDASEFARISLQIEKVQKAKGKHQQELRVLTTDRLQGLPVVQIDDRFQLLRNKVNPNGESKKKGKSKKEGNRYCK
jgi:hypothetical protein